MYFIQLPGIFNCLSNLTHTPGIYNCGPHNRNELNTNFQGFFPTVEWRVLVNYFCDTMLEWQDPLESGVITCGTIVGGSGYNIIPDRVRITGTSRWFTPQTRDVIKERMQCACCGVAQTYGGDITLDYQGILELVVFLALKLCC